MIEGDWVILGIPPTDDPKVLRRAYTQSLRRHPPETDPQGFMRLRGAYERLLAHLQTPASPPPPSTPLAEPSPVPQAESGVGEAPRRRWTPLPDLSGAQLERWTLESWSRFQRLWNSPGGWEDAPRWQAWMEEVAARGSDDLRPLEALILGFFGGFFLGTPHERAMQPVVRMLVVGLRWESRRRELYGLHDRRVVHALIRVASGNCRVPRPQAPTAPHSVSRTPRYGRWIFLLVCAAWVVFFLNQCLFR